MLGAGAAGNIGRAAEMACLEACRCRGGGPAGWPDPRSPAPRPQGGGGAFTARGISDGGAKPSDIGEASARAPEPGQPRMVEMCRSAGTDGRARRGERVGDRPVGRCCGVPAAATLRA